jgi:hypothetical protein
MSGLLDLVDALEVAAAWLTQEFTSCTCATAAVEDLDVDPDCPGLHVAADGCRAHAHLAARVALHDAGIPVPDGQVTWLRDRVLAMHADLVGAIDTVATRHGPARAAEDDLREVIRLLADVCAAPRRRPRPLRAVTAA